MATLYSPFIHRYFYSSIVDRKKKKRKKNYFCDITPNKFTLSSVKKKRYSFILQNKNGVSKKETDNILINHNNEKKEHFKMSWIAP